MKKVVLPLLLVPMMLATQVHADSENQEVLDRIRPVGMVNIQGGNAAPAPAAQPAVAAKKLSPGETVYNGHCVVCHAAGVAGAPKAHTADWAPRKSKGVDGLLKSAIAGINAMPAKGTCAECSDQDLRAAIEFMLPK